MQRRAGPAPQQQGPRRRRRQRPRERPAASRTVRRALRRRPRARAGSGRPSLLARRRGRARIFRGDPAQCALDALTRAGYRQQHSTDLPGSLLDWTCAAAVVAEKDDGTRALGLARQDPPYC